MVNAKVQDSLLTWKCELINSYYTLKLILNHQKYIPIFSLLYKIYNYENGYVTDKRIGTHVTNEGEEVLNETLTWKFLHPSG